MGFCTLAPLFTFGFSHLFLAGIHGCQQMHRRASQTAWGGAAKRPKVRSSQDFWADVLSSNAISSCPQSIPNHRQQNNVVWFWVRDKLCMLFLRNAFCVGIALKSVRQKGRLWAQCGVDWGHFSWRSFRADLPRQWEWRAYGDANLMTLSPPCS